MSPMRQSMVDAMTVRGLSVRTIECNTESISCLSRHYGGQLYLSRYTHRTAIANERILSLQGDGVVSSARATQRRPGKLHGAGGPGEHPTMPGVPARAHGCGADLGESQTPARPV
ncbi:MAG: transposase [Hydrogenophaga sp.]|nr:transposase [Hydrogenophaga sp.]